MGRGGNELETLAWRVQEVETRVPAGEEDDEGSGGGSSEDEDDSLEKQEDEGRGLIKILRLLSLQCQNFQGIKDFNFTRECNMSQIQLGFPLKLLKMGGIGFF